MVVQVAAETRAAEPLEVEEPLAGYARMRDAALAALRAASDGGRLPIDCDATLCTDYVEVLVTRGIR